MDSMFNNANKFNQNIGNWNVSRVTTFQQMFLNATMFNNGGSSDINNWQLSTTFDINISQMFANAIAFNQNIGSWNVSMVTTFTGMFQGAKAFNNGGSSSINGWPIKTTGSVIMTSMFKDAISFNQPVGLWNVSNVTSMYAMFYGCKNFNQNISTWNTIGVTTMNAMFFNAINFNQPIGSWNVSNVTIMSFMFCVDSAGGGNMQFNQPIGSWDVSKVTNMNGMFDGLSFTSLFNQNIGSWNISNVTNFGNFMRKKTASNFSTTNLDAIYNGWSSRLVQPNINILFGTAKYTSASSAGRAILTGTPNNWVITDGGM
jgi:surface protein